MKRYAKSLTGLLLVSVLTGCAATPGPKPAKVTGNRRGSTSDTSFFFGARIIPGDGSPAMEDMSFIVTAENSPLSEREVRCAAKGPARIELTGRTVTPVFINLQAQPGMNNGAQYGPKNYTRDSMTADLSRYAYYGVMAVADALEPMPETSPLRSATSCSKARSKAHDCSRPAEESRPRAADLRALPKSRFTFRTQPTRRERSPIRPSRKSIAIKLWMDDGNGKGAEAKARCLYRGDRRSA